jgi:C4-dicarboxylate-specific signal transduction histidine kinase
MGILPGDDIESLLMERLIYVAVICAIALAAAIAVVLLWRRTRRRGAARIHENREIVENAVCGNTAEILDAEERLDAMVVEREIVFIHTDAFIR